MNPEEWERVQSLFLEALKRDSGDRQAFIDEVSKDDATLRRQLTSLLRADQEEGLLDGAESNEEREARLERLSAALDDRCRKFFVVDRVSKEVSELYASTWDVLGPPRLTRDGRRMYYSRRTNQADLWLMEFR